MKVKFEMIIDYDARGSTFDEIKRELNAVSALIYDEGLFTGLLYAEVDEYTTTVTLIEE